MKRKMIALALALATAASVAACQTPQQQNAVVGGALGAGTGALVGSAVSGGSAGGALAGAAIGAGTGALIGSAATPSPPITARRRADAPNGLTTTTATGFAPPSIEPDCPGDRASGHARPLNEPRAGPSWGARQLPCCFHAQWVFGSFPAHQFRNSSR